MVPSTDCIIRWHGCTAYRFPAHDSFVYLIHFEQPIGDLSNPRGQARHYLGSTSNLQARMALHRNGNGAAIMTAVGLAGVRWQVAGLWRTDTREDARALELRLKKRHNGPALCPLCNPRRGPDVLVMLKQGHWPIALHTQPGRRQPMNARRADPLFIRRK